MLTQLTIQNFGLIDQVSLEFDSHLNILTGETGAGKSIVIDALRIALGERIQISQLRDEQKVCIIEAVFEIADKKLRSLSVWEDFIADGEQTLIIQRTLKPDGKGTIKINGLSVTVGQLKEIGNYLIDFHGAHDHQMLFSVDSHRIMLDQLVDFDDVLEKYKAQYHVYANLKNELNKLQELSSSRERELDLLTHQVKELAQVSLDQTKYDELMQEQTKLNNAERLHECIANLLQLLEDQDGSSSELIRQSFTPMRTLNDLDPKTSLLFDLLSQIQDLNGQLTSQLRDYADGLSFEPEQALQINNQCDMYDNILRKYGPSLEQAKKFYDEVKIKYDLLMNFEHSDAELRSQIKLSEKALTQFADELTKQRLKAATSLKKTIEKELSELGMPHVKFEARIERVDFHSLGCDRITFYISPNVGIELKPLADIVSSGEAARVMLGLKKALIKVDPIPVLIFDEIDAQIGGRLGTITGQKLREIAQCRQVILITHLPQIASFADVHFKVSKGVDKNRAVTKVSFLNKEDRVKELAKMMSGEDETQIALKHAHNMLAKAKN